MMIKDRYMKMQIALFVIVGILIVGLLLYLGFMPNVETKQIREANNYEIVDDVVYEEIIDESAPCGVVRQFRFTLTEQLEYDTDLIFRFSHQNAEVYLDDEQVYTLHTSPKLSMVKTPGVNWAMIPLYREDIGKSVVVNLTPVYENYQDQTITFLIGSKLAVYKVQFAKSILAMILSAIDILAGLFLLCIALYFSLKKTESEGFYALAFLAISLGLWNFTQTEFASLILDNKTPFVYYISFTMLIASIMPLIKSVKVSDDNFISKLFNQWCIVCGLISIVQLIFQIFGICDLRETIKITHGLIIISAIFLIIISIMEWCTNLYPAGNHRRSSYVWLLGIGALLDMILYYIGDNSSGLLFILLAILFYVLMEGIQMFFSYTKQQQILEEKENQLTLSRITTMMSQIRSHFVFNILNAISGMCKYNPEKADETIVRFARYLRNNIDIMEDDKPITFSTELARLEDYVVLEQVRFGDHIEFYTDVKVDNFLIPPLILQPIVENAIKHGLTKKINGGTIVLRTWEDEENIKISIEDDGVGFAIAELEKDTSVGLKNIRYRLHHLMHGTLDIESRIGVGTTVTITIPKKESEICI